MIACNQVMYVIEQAMRSHDDEAPHWLQRVIALQNSPEGQPHARALAIARAYLEELDGRRVDTTGAGRA